MDLGMDPEPWNWSVDDVVYFFQHRATSYIADMPHSRLPPLEPLLRAVQENDIAGALLLTEVDTKTLKDDFGISSAGLRGVVLRCIKKLQNQSLKWLSEQSSQTLQTPILQTPTPTSAQPVSNVVASQNLPPASSETLAKSTRSGEVQFQDKQGKKRRRLNVSSLVPVQEKQTKPEDVFPTADSIGTANQGYLSSSACPVDELFYSKTAFGEEVASLYPKGEVMVDNRDRAAGQTDENFHFTSQNKPVGEAHYVSKQMRHFLINNNMIELERNERPAIALALYRGGLESSRSATVVQFRPEAHEPVAIKENLEHLKSGHMPAEYMQQPSGEWDFLVEKHKSDEDQVLPVYGESDDEDGDDSIPLTEGDLQDAAEEEIDDHLVPKDRVAEMIEDSVNGHIAKWQFSLDKLEKKKAWTVWKKTKGSRTIRFSLIQTAQGRIEHLNIRLNKLKNEIMCTEHRTEKSVQDACVFLEVTVEDREEQLWMINVWKRKQEPFHTIHHATHNAHQGLPTPLTTGKAERPFHIHPNDRFSVSPAPNGVADTDDEMRDDTGSVEGAETDGEARYEADVETEDEILYDAPEDVHIPAHSSGPDDPDSAFLDSTDEVEPNSDDAAPNAEELLGLVPSTDTETTPDDALLNGDDKNSDFSPEEEPEESEELASPSTFVKPMKSSPRPKSQPIPRTTFIDLTGISSDSSATKKKMKASERAAAYSGAPQGATASMVDSWDMRTLASNNDRQRIMIKLLRNAGAQNRQRLYTCYTSNRADFTTRLLPACQFARESGTAGVGLIEDDVEAISLAGSICVSWLWPTLSADDIRNMSDATFRKELDAKQLDLFTSMFSGLLQKRDGSLFNTPMQTPSKKIKKSSRPVISISSDDSPPQPSQIARRQRKRAVKMSQSGLNSRVKAHQREQKFAESQTANSSQLASMMPGESSSSNIEINPVRDDGTDPVYIHARIGKKMKAHQIDGVQFLWREITADDDDGAQGCVLAHTMGLGKTMQTIALLAAVNEAARSKKRSVYRQVPHHLRPDGIRERMLRVLILCPPALIENWNREMEQWAPKMLGNIFSIDSGSKATHLRQLEDWMRLGGIVLLGYQRFRMMVLQKVHAKQKAPVPEEQLARLKDILLSGTEIVVADEAHNLKNNKSEIGKAAAQIETHSRIGLTGTPMSNDVEEIYAVISWAAPGYLGDPTEFRAQYTEPIKDGLWPDSTQAEKRKSTVKLKALHSEIQPKVNRANIEVLRGSLRPKVEYVITVALGEDQTELYKRYIKALQSGDGNSEADQVTIFSWLAVLTLLTNHPRCFRMKLLAPPPKKKSAKTAQQTEDVEDDISRNRTPGTTESGSATPASEYMVKTTEQLIDAEVTREAPADAPLHKLGLNESMIQQILDGFEEDFDPQLSAKVTIFLTLLEYSRECGDKVLVFSSSIPTLEYLDELLTQHDILFGRIDGQTSMQKRMQALEEFHNDEFDIMLVSTRAGGVGLNIQGANRVFIFDFGFNPTWEEQAIGRAYRLGQTKPVYVYRFVAGGTFETEIYNKQLFKMSLAQRVVDKKKPQRHAKRDTREYLYVPKPVKQEDLNEEAGKDPKVLDRLLSQHGQAEDGKFDTMIRAIKTMETLQEEALDEELDEEGQREVELEIQQGRLRMKGKKAPGAAQMPAPPSSLMVKVPNPTQPTPQSHTGAPAFVQPSSTFAGPSNYPQPANHPLGGLPLPRMQRPTSSESLERQRKESSV